MSLYNLDNFTNTTAICDIHGKFTQKIFYLSENIIHRSSCFKCVEIDKLKAEKQNDLLKQQELKQKIYELKQFANIPSRYFNLSFNDYKEIDSNKKENKNIAMNYIKLWEKNHTSIPNLIFMGNVGTSKTTLASIIINTLINKYQKSCLYTDLNPMLREITKSKNFNSQEDPQKLINKYSNIELLILDEVEGISNSTNELSIFTEIINNRYKNTKPTLLISNFTKEQLYQILGHRPIDRLFNKDSKILYFTGESLRH